MSQVTMPCTCCGLLLEFPPETALLTCPACGTRNACPKTKGESLLSLQRATEQRLACDFHAAELSYQDSSHFINLFKRFEGITPQVYRQYNYR